MAAVVVSRELLVTSLRTFIETRGGNFGAVTEFELRDEIGDCGHLDAAVLLALLEQDA